jgi:undecaprenyl-diphosphatase
VLPVSGRLGRLDAHLLDVVQRLHCRQLTGAFRALTRLGDASSWAFACLLLYCAGGPGARPLAARLAVATLLSTAITQLLKRAIARPRPSRHRAGPGQALALIEVPDAFSFPSGHAAAAGAAAVVLATQGGAAALGAWTLAVAIAVSRVYLGAHYPFDVMAGATLGILAGRLALATGAG